MPIVTCGCGARLNAPDRLAGKLVPCPKCTAPVKVPAAEAVAEPELDLMPLAPSSAPDPLPARVAAPAPRRAIPPRPPPSPPVPAWKLYGRWALGLALLPLVFSVFSKNDGRERYEQMLASDPKLATKIDQLERRNAKEEEIFDALPQNRIPGALVAHSSKIHWLFALLSAGAFWGFLLLVYPMGNSTAQGLWGVGVFTGTIGIVLLLALQIAAQYSQGMM